MSLCSPKFIQVLARNQRPQCVVLLEDKHLNQYGPTASLLQEQTHKQTVGYETENGRTNSLQPEGQLDNEQTFAVE